MAIKIPPITRTQEASDTPFDNSTNGLVSTDVQAAIEEVNTVRSFTAMFNRSGSVPASTWLLSDTIPSNISGYAIAPTAANIVKIFVSNQDPTVMNLEFYTHDGNGINLTLIGTAVTAATRSNTFSVTYSVAVNKQIAVRLGAASAAGKNLIVGCLVRGSN